MAEAFAKSVTDFFNKSCTSFQGKTGLGDGPKTKGLDSYPGDFSTCEFQNQADDNCSLEPNQDVMKCPSTKE